MNEGFFYPEYEVIRNLAKCTLCRICTKQCANGVHIYDAKNKRMLADDGKCVNCQRCVAFCPTRALKIIKSENTMKVSSNWSSDAITAVSYTHLDVYKRQVYHKDNKNKSFFYFYENICFSSFLLSFL